MGLALRQWIILMAFYTVYLIFGAAIFYKIEHELEAERRAEALQERIDINGRLQTTNYMQYVYYRTAYTIQQSSKAH